VDDTDQDLREFRREQRRVRRRNAVVSVIIGAVLIPVAIPLRHWAEALDAVQANETYPFEMPRRIIAACWGGTIVGVVCLLVAGLLFALTLTAAARERG